MGLSVALVGAAPDVSIPGRLRFALIDVTFDSSYPTGGEALDPGLVGFSSIHAVAPLAKASGLVVSWDVDNEKLMVFRSAALSLTGEAQEVAQAALAEVSSAVNLSTLVVRCLVVGV